MADVSNSTSLKHFQQLNLPSVNLPSTQRISLSVLKLSIEEYWSTCANIPYCDQTLSKQKLWRRLRWNPPHVSILDDVGSCSVSRWARKSVSQCKSGDQARSSSSRAFARRWAIKKNSIMRKVLIIIFHVMSLTFHSFSILWSTHVYTEFFSIRVSRCFFRKLCSLFYFRMGVAKFFKNSINIPRNEVGLR